MGTVNQNIIFHWSLIVNTYSKSNLRGENGTSIVRWSTKLTEQKELTEQEDLTELKELTELTVLCPTMSFLSIFVWHCTGLNQSGVLQYLWDSVPVLLRFSTGTLEIQYTGTLEIQYRYSGDSVPVLWRFSIPVLLRFCTGTLEIQYRYTSTLEIGQGTVIIVRCSIIIGIANYKSTNAFKCFKTLSNALTIEIEQKWCSI